MSQVAAIKTDFTTGGPRLILRAEGGALALAAAAAYAASGHGWVPFAALFLTPDLSFAAYAFGPRLGAFAYNGVHSTVPALALAALGQALGATEVVGVALIWLAHVGFDRALGYGLKHSSGFADTQLGRIGKA